MRAQRTSRRAFVGVGGAALARAAIAAPSQPARAAGSPAIGRGVALTGRVIRPGDPDYEAARGAFNARFSRFPAAIVLCGNVADVRNAVRWALRQGVELRVRSGGHSYEAFSMADGALVVDVGGLNAVAVDAAAGQAVVGAGVRLLDLYRRLWDFGVTLPAGTCLGVGIAGLTLGGGVGFLSRQFGLTCDHLLAADLVAADGGTLRASAEEHADLFWALRGGGGGNFGIATAFTFRVRPIADVAVFRVEWPWDDAAAVFDAWQRWAPLVDERLAAGLTLLDPSAGVVVAVGQLNGPAAELPGLLAPLLGAGTPGPPDVSTVPFLTAAERFAGPAVAHAAFKNTSAFAEAPLPPAAIAALVDGLRASPTTDNLVGCFPLGGAVAAVDPAATAFVHRRSLVDLQIQAYWHDPADEPADVAWAGDVREALAPYASGAYVNYVDADLPDWAAAYYGANLPRLAWVKAAYDPDGVFGGPQSIPAAVAG